MINNFMARHGARLVDNGYPIIPIWPGTKKPGRFHRGAWRDYPAWTRHCERPTTLNETEIWATWPDCAIGMACGTVVGIDIDVLDSGLAHRIEELAREMLGDTPLLRIGKAPKRLLVYRTDEPFSGPKRQPLEILGLGRQFVAFAVHPDTGRAYEWPEDSPLSVAFSDLPAITKDQAAVWLDAAWAVLPDDLKPATLPAATGTLPSLHLLAGTREAVREALAFIPNADLDYDSWVRIGMALKGALGDDGADLFAAWSAQSAKDVPETTNKSWASFRPTSIGAGTLYHHALTNGWKPDSALVLDGTAPRDPVHPAAGLLAKVQAAPSPPAVPSFDLAIPGGILGDLVGYMLATARRPQPLLALGAGLCAIGALMGRKYRTESNLRSNLYIIGIADSGSGKNHGREVVNELFVEAGLGAWLGGNKIASGAGLLTALHRQPAILFQIDEFGMFLATAADRRRSPRHITEILDNMTELYTAAGGIFLGAEYANRDGKNERRDINQPCLCVYGTTTPQHFWNALQSANVVDGSLARFIIVQTEDDYPEENAAAGIRHSPPALLDSLRLIADGGGHKPAGNLSGKVSGPSIGVEPMTVPAARNARDAFISFSSDITNQLRQAKGTSFTSILARIAENAAKVALIRAVSLDPVSPVIRLDDAEWAIAFVRHFAERTILEVERHVADNETERSHKRLMEIIRASGASGISKSDLTWKSRFLDKRQRDEIIASLVEAGMVESVMRVTATKPVMVLVAVHGGPR
ncbi:MAG: PriCT-2 domain-containing protein [Rhodospirillales bacterium]|nr:PriCT-2 domain-containing protein [Rhodospirillales bacterium]